MARRGRPKIDKEPKRRAVKVRLCERMHAGKVVEPYRIMEEVITTDRRDLADLKIGIAWHTGWRPDADGVRKHGQCQKRSDLDRSLDTYDAMIILNEKSWLAFAAEEKLRLVTHELEHIQIASDKNGEPLIDDKGRQVLRMKRHDVADFASIIKRFGLPTCLSDVQIHDADRPLLKLAEAKAKEGGTTETTESAEKKAPAKATPTIPDAINLKFKGLRNCKGLISLGCRADGLWFAAWSIEVGNLQKVCSASEAPVCSCKIDALQNAKSGIQCWCEDIEPTGNADTKRSMKRRLVEVCDQLDAQLDAFLNKAEEFAEDPDPSQDDGAEGEAEVNADEDEE